MSLSLSGLIRKDFRHYLPAETLIPLGQVVGQSGLMRA